jgi:membrane protein implicated in regulation of membrane protease activity
MSWWIWMLLLIALMAIEAATPGGLFFLFFGISAIAVGLLTGVGWLVQPWLEWASFSAISVLTLILLRRPLKARVNLDGESRPVDRLEGEGGVVLEELPGSGVGKVELRGSTWNARSVAGTMAKGTRCRVERVDGLTLWVRPE